MSTTSTAQVETLHPRPARKPAAARPRTAKVKATTVPLHGWRNLDEIMRRGLANARAALGLASGLHELLALRLAEAEEDLSRLGRSTGDDAGPRYVQQLRHTEDLRTWAAVLAAIKDRATRAECDARSAAERVGYAVRRGGSQ